jgi:hypothetical protein
MRKGLVIRVLRIIMVVGICLIFIQVIDACSTKVFGHGAW